jgi:type II secretory pathway pseudopilin PulG
MPTGSPPARARPPGGGPQRGFSYLAVLFLVALTAAGLARLGQAWSTAAQRERERELEFRGGEIAAAIASYQRAAGTEPAPYPATLQDLLIDERGPRPRHHLRRLYADPMTGQPDWVLVPDPMNPARFRAVHSRSDAALLRRFTPQGQPLAKASDWLFDPLAAATSQPATAASAPRAQLPAPSPPPQPQPPVATPVQPLPTPGQTSDR